MNPSPLGFGSSCHHLLPPALPPVTLLSAELSEPLRCHSSELSSGHSEAVSRQGLSGRGVRMHEEAGE